MECATTLTTSIPYPSLNLSRAPYSSCTSHLSHPTRIPPFPTPPLPHLGTRRFVDHVEFEEAVGALFPEGVDGTEVGNMYDRVMAVADDNADGTAAYDAAAVAFSSVMMEYIGREVERATPARRKSVLVQQRLSVGDIVDIVDVIDVIDVIDSTAAETKSDAQPSEMGVGAGVGGAVGAGVGGASDVALFCQKQRRSSIARRLSIAKTS